MTVHFNVLGITLRADIVERLRKFSAHGEFTLHITDTISDALRLFEQGTLTPHLILLEGSCTHMDTMRRIAGIQQFGGDIPLALITQGQSTSDAVEAGNAGVTTFLDKSLKCEDLLRLVNSLKRSPAAGIEKRPAEIDMNPHVTYFNDGTFFLAGSPPMLEILRQIDRIAPPDVPVLITGESGVGKEMVARMLHQRSRRAHRSMLKVNCAALPTELLESELFGYEVGAFTGAIKSKPGKFEQCDRGTILLDEIAEMSTPLQAKLLQVLQDGSFSRLGSRLETQVNVRVIAATNVDIECALAERRLREDLLYRLNTFVIEVPPLRERRVEIPYLLRDMSQRFATIHNVEPIEFSSRLIAAALEYQWPGNLRELNNFVKRHHIMRDEAMALVSLQHKTPSRYTPQPQLRNGAPKNSDQSVPIANYCPNDDTETAMLRAALEAANWNRRVAAEKLQINYRILLCRIRQCGLEAPETFVAQRAV